jgi:hypothetical protein
MAGDDSYRRGCVVNSFAKKIQAKLGILVVSIE